MGFLRKAMLLTGLVLAAAGVSDSNSSKGLNRDDAATLARNSLTLVNEGVIKDNPEVEIDLVVPQYENPAGISGQVTLHFGHEGGYFNTWLQQYAGGTTCDANGCFDDEGNPIDESKVQSDLEKFAQRIEDEDVQSSVNEISLVQDDNASLGSFNENHSGNGIIGGGNGPKNPLQENVEGLIRDPNVECLGRNITTFQFQPGQNLPNIINQKYASISEQRSIRGDNAHGLQFEHNGIGDNINTWKYNSGGVEEGTTYVELPNTAPLVDFMFNTCEASEQSDLQGGGSVEARG